jgi:hypothetical protein
VQPENVNWPAAGITSSIFVLLANRSNGSYNSMSVDRWDNLSCRVIDVVPTEYLAGCQESSSDGSCVPLSFDKVLFAR